MRRISIVNSCAPIFELENTMNRRVVKAMNASFHCTAVHKHNYNASMSVLREIHMNKHESVLYF